MSLEFLLIYQAHRRKVARELAAKKREERQKLAQGVKR